MDIDFIWPWAGFMVATMDIYESLGTGIGQQRLAGAFIPGLLECPLAYSAVPPSGLAPLCDRGQWFSLRAIRWHILH